MIKQILIFLICTFLMNMPAMAEEYQYNATIEELFNKGLEETSSIATRTRLNVDDIPAFVSILYQEELIKLGIDDIYEALCLVPGIEPFMEPSGVRQLIFRGVKEKGKVKLLIDGIDINNTFRGAIYYYYDFPVELVQRIEVIRGPGAVLHGSGAMSGVINIVTRASDRLGGSDVFGSAGSYDNYKGGMICTYNSGNLHLAIDGYYNQGNRGIDGGPDKAGHYGTSDETKHGYSVGMVAENRHLKFTTRYKRSRDGLAFGRMNYFEPDDDMDGLTNTTLLSELAYSSSITPDFDLTIKGGYSYYREEAESRAVPYPEDWLIYNVKYSEDKLYSDISLTGTLLQDHSLTGGLRFENSQEHDDCFEAFMQTMPRTYLMPDSVIKPHISRQVGSFYFNDQYHLNRKLDLSFGARYDIYSDVDNAVNPRLGIIYRWNSQLNFKALYSRSYRIPSWMELYINIPRPYTGKPDLTSEKSDTVETGIVFHTPKSRTSFNIYWSQINDLIIFAPKEVKYTQHGRHQFLGGELTWHYQFSENADMDIDLSYVYGTDANNDKLPDIANWLGNMVFMYSFDYGITSATHLRFASKRYRAQGDPRDNLDGYTVVDEIFSYRLGKADLVAGVKNIFDHEVCYPAMPGTYPRDYPREGRTYIVKLSYDF